VTGQAVEELRTLFLFEGLTPDQLDWLAARGDVRTYAAGSTVYRQGEPATHLFLLLEGSLRLLRTVAGEDLVINEATAAPSRCACPRRRRESRGRPGVGACSASVAGPGQREVRPWVKACTSSS